MSLYTYFCANVLFPLHEMLKGHQSFEIRKNLEKSQWKPLVELSAERENRLKSFLSYCYENVPYYAELFKELGLTPDDITQISDLEKLPFLDKRLIRNNFDGIKSKNAGSSKVFTTGGSSGTPLKFLLGNERVSHDVAEKWRATRWWGVDIGDREIVAWGSPIELTKQDRLKSMRDFIFRTKLIPAFDLSVKNKILFLKKIKRFKPKMLFGYPSVYYVLAKEAEKNKIDMSQIGIKVIFVTSERLYDYQRELIERIFNAPVANGYGGRDAGFIAHECPSGKMHISAEDIIVEVVRNDGTNCEPGESGEIVVTHMATGDFPFIRYKTGDIGRLSNDLCDCGRGLPVLEQVEGRTTDFVVASNGTQIHGLSLIYILREIDSVDSFKIVQESTAKTSVLIVPTSTYTDSVEENIVAAFKARLGSNVTIDITIVDSIAAEASGKYRYVVSKVAS
ncbi:phenylacetate--CoA ligase family protein [Alteromonas sp. MTD1]|uniref:phenylacetate--CoA ligase family protein n=1 Tax=Alteromonas sp. MTD1 TaxID=3057962 RepID=UPI0036F1D559